MIETTTTPIAKVTTFSMPWLLIFPLLVATVIIPRWYYVENYAVALPLGDQWDAEWVGLLRPWTEGKLSFSDLLTGHNEHRIFPTRLLTLLSFTLTGLWSNLSEVRLNILLGASTPLLLIWLMHKMRALYGIRWLVAAVIVAGAILPFSWENMLIGFQSQFYFLNLFALSALALAVYRPASTWAMLTVTVLCLLSVITMASGLLTPLALAMVYFLYGYIHQKRTARILFMIIILLVIAAIAYLTMPYVEGHQVLRARNMADMFKTTIRVLGWPLTDHKLYIGLLWLPAIIIIPILLVRRSFGRCDLLMVGCFIWTGLQILALAYGRGHVLYNVSSRYTEILHLGLAANAWFILRSTEAFRSSGKLTTGLRLIALTFFIAVFVSHRKRAVKDFEIMRLDHESRLAQTQNVYDYLKTRNEAILQKPGAQIPYPSPGHLQAILNNPGLPAVLPVFNSSSVEKKKMP